MMNMMNLPKEKENQIEDLLKEVDMMSKMSKVMMMRIMTMNQAE